MAFFLHHLYPLLPNFPQNLLTPLDPLTKPNCSGKPIFNASGSHPRNSIVTVTGLLLDCYRSYRRACLQIVRGEYTAMNKPSKRLSPHLGFYRSFGRPIAKVFLGGVVTYQTVYWVWVKLETDEVKEEKRSGRSQSLMTNTLR